MKCKDCAYWGDTGSKDSEGGIKGYCSKNEWNCHPEYGGCNDFVPKVNLSQSKKPRKYYSSVAEMRRIGA